MARTPKHGPTCGTPACGVARRPRTAAIVLVVAWCLLFLATAPPADAAGAPADAAGAPADAVGTDAHGSRLVGSDAPAAGAD